MFFESLDEICDISRRCGTAIFVVPNDYEVEIPNAIILQPEGKSVIAIEQVRKVLERLSVKQTSDLFIVIRPAETLNAEFFYIFIGVFRTLHTENTGTESHV